MLATRTYLLILAFAVSITPLAPPTFGVEPLGPAESVFPVGDLPQALVFANLDGSGGMDLAVANTADDTLSVLLGDGQGGFVILAPALVGDAPIALASALIDSDPLQDLVVANHGDDAIAILRGAGDGTFTPLGTVSVPGGPSSVALADLDADGCVDMLVAAEDTDLLHGALGDCAGNFTFGTPLPVGDRPRSIVIGDLDGDARLDIAVACWGFSNDGVNVLLGDGAGGFGPAASFEAGTSPYSVAIIDLDRDGTPDLATANLLGESVTLLLGDGAGGYSSVGEIPVGASPTSIVAADFNTDGQRDLLVSNSSGNSLTLLTGDGVGGVSGVQDFAVGIPPFALAAADADVDGTVDVALVSRFRDSLAFLRGNGLGAFVRAKDVAVGTLPIDAQVGDLNADGLVDIAVLSLLGVLGGQQLANVDILFGDGRGGFVVGAPAFAGEQPASLALVDLDNDSSLDLIVPGRQGSTVLIWLGRSDGGFDAGPDFNVGASAPIFADAADFNGDGNADLIVASLEGATITVAHGDGAGNFTTGQSLPSIGVRPRTLVVSDLTGDGVPDVAVGDEGNGHMSVLLADATGLLTMGPSIDLGGPIMSLAAADMNDDGAMDLVAAIEDGDTVTILLGQGNGQFSARAEPATSSPRDVALVDVDEDGALDIVVAGRDAVSLLVGDGEGGFVRAATVGAGRGPAAVVVGDFDGDDRDDVAVANGDSKSVSLLFNRVDDRADVNRTNRVDGFDIGEVARRSGLALGDTGFRGNADVVPDGLIDGEDLARIGARFGEKIVSASPLRAELSGITPTLSNSIGFRQVETLGDQITLELLVQSTLAASAADVTLAITSTDGDPSQLLELVSFEPGDFLTGGSAQIYNVSGATPGRVRIQVFRQPVADSVAPGERVLVHLVFRALREGSGELSFAPGSQLLFSDGCPAPEGCEIPGIGIAATAQVAVNASAGGPPSSRVAVAPGVMEFPATAPGMSTTTNLRLANLGFSNLNVLDVSITPELFGSGLRCNALDVAATCALVPPLGAVLLPVIFEPSSEGVFSGELVIRSDDPGRPEFRVPVSGISGSSLGVTPERLDFGLVAVGLAKDRVVRISNRGNSPLVFGPTSFDNTAFSIVGSLPTIPAGSSVDLLLRYAPTAAGESRGTMRVTFEGPAQRRIILALSGSGS